MLDEYIADVVADESPERMLDCSLLRAARELRAHESWLQPPWLEYGDDHRGSVSRNLTRVRMWRSCNVASGEISWR